MKRTKVDGFKWLRGHSRNCNGISWRVMFADWTSFLGRESSSVRQHGQKHGGRNESTYDRDNKLISCIN